MLLSKIPKSLETVGNPVVATSGGCDCHDCHDTKVTPPPHILIHPTLTLDNWETLCPANDGKTIEVSVHWSPKDKETSIAAEEAAREMLSKLAPVGAEMELYVQALAAYLVQYADLIEEQLDNRLSEKLKATLVASRGRNGTKCPLWHADNVPIRWIQALAGPGCEFVTNSDGVNWDAWEGHQRQRFNSVEAKNRHRIPSAAGAGIYKAKTQEIALLRGGRWNDSRKIDYPKSFPDVHRSPAFIPPDQARLLLKQDVSFSYDK